LRALGTRKKYAVNRSRIGEDITKVILTSSGNGAVGTPEKVMVLVVEVSTGRIQQLAISLLHY
jgi:hypothetical protein